MRKNLRLVGFIVGAVVIAAVYFIYATAYHFSTNLTTNGQGVARHPDPNPVNNGSMKSLPTFDPSTGGSFQIDLRGADLTHLNLEQGLDTLLYADFNTQTSWPAALPGSYKPDQIMQMGQNPGLEIRKLHEAGITGKGVGVGIVDQTLLVDHEEYKQQLKLYEEIHLGQENAALHGPAVASILVGKTSGVAPEAELYYIAHSHVSAGIFNHQSDYIWTAKAIRRLMDINRNLPEESKIRVISISKDWEDSSPGFQEVMAAAQEALDAGILVVAPRLRDYLKPYSYDGLGRDPLSDPDEVSSYGSALYWTNFAEDDYKLLVPMDSRAFASRTGNQEYVFNRSGGVSWATPYVAGLYALSCQVNPEVTPEIFWEKALETTSTVPIDFNGQTGSAKVVDPVRLIESLAKFR